MYNLKELAQECIENLNAIGIYPCVTVNDFSVNKRAKRRYGQCCYKNGKFSINISSFLLDDRNSVKSIQTSIYHELCHACKETIYDGHGGKWKEYANLVNDCYNVDIQRVSSMKDKVDTAVYNEIVAERKAKIHYTHYTCYCPTCKKIVAERKFARRAPKWYKHTELYTCVNCNNKGLIATIEK